MRNDTVREELQTKITPGISLRGEIKAEPRSTLPPPPRPTILAPPAPAAVKQVNTAGLSAPKTSPTLVEFQNKNSTLPDWRLQMQNAVQQRRSGHIVEATASGPAAQFPTNGSAALKAEPVSQTTAPPSGAPSDPRIAAALKRIEDSRNAFLEPQPVKTAPAAKPMQMRPFPFDLVPTGGNVPGPTPAKVEIAAKPILVSSQPVVAEKRDTNKLPPIEIPAPPMIARVEPLETVVDEIASSPLTTDGKIKRIQIKAENLHISGNDTSVFEEEEIEDLAPFSMRFGAGLFDLIIGTFAAMLLLSPLAFTNGNWFAPAGVLTFAGTFAIFMFLYMTISLGFYGKTMGMRLFSLELVDAVENEYPTLQQAAINSSVFLLSLLFAGAGFLTVFFNEENRCLHDLLSGTIIVREF